MTRTAFAHRRPLPPPNAADRRQAWRDLLDAALVQSATVSAGGQVDRFATTVFLGQLVRARQMKFPLEHNTATVAAEIFLRLAGAFSIAARPEDREALGDLMREAVRCLDRLLSQEAQRGIARTTGDHT
jgi:hypothetical protein